MEKRKMPTNSQINSVASLLKQDRTKPCSKCGRSLERQHCPKCGSINLARYRTQGGWMDIPDVAGVMQHVLIRGFVCRRCDTPFNELTPCEATPPPATRSQQAAQVLIDLGNKMSAVKERYGQTKNPDNYRMLLGQLVVVNQERRKHGQSLYKSLDEALVDDRFIELIKPYLKDVSMDVLLDIERLHPSVDDDVDDEAADSESEVDEASDLNKGE